jgi:hypothetical protein
MLKRMAEKCYNRHNLTHLYILAGMNRDVNSLKIKCVKSYSVTISLNNGSCKIFFPANGKNRIEFF